MYLAVSNVSKSYGVQQVLDQVSFTLNAGERLGLVGANGVGKSTLLKIIVGEIEADSNPVLIAHGLQIGYLPQVVANLEGKTLDELIADSLRNLRQAETRMHELESAMTSAPPEQLKAIMQEYAAVTEQFERYGGYEIEHKIDAVLNGLGVGDIPRDRRASTLSGGEKSRVGLALLLLQSPDVLLLDEPTNHLDFDSLGWLEDYLQSYRGGVLIVSHDRHFLNRTVTAIVEIEEHSRKTKHYAGNYDDYLRLKALERIRWAEDYEKQQEEIIMLREQIKAERHSIAHSGPTRKVSGDKFAKGFFKGRSEISKSRKIASAEERLKRIEADPIPEPPEDLRFEPDFDPAALQGAVALYVSGLNKAFGERSILRDVTFTLGARSRVALVGPNGVGKSTLIKILAGYEKPDSGEVYINSMVKVGYLDQEQETLVPNRSLFETYREGLPGTEQQHKAILLSSGLFRYEELERKVGQLSSGQKRKLQIARLMAERANCLVLDEPTNYVSFDVLESFEAALRDFPGPIIAASHDRRFLQKFSTEFGGEIWEIREGKLIQQFSFAIPSGR